MMFSIIYAFEFIGDVFVKKEFGIDNLKEKFHEFGYKYTDQRQLVMDVIIEHKDLHMNSEDINRILKQKGLNIGQSTIYRTLVMLEKMKFIRKVDLGDGYTRYELCNHLGYTHYHLICSDCGKIIDGRVTDREYYMLDKLKKQIYDIYDFQVEDYSVDFFGKCKSCNKNPRE